MHIRFFNNTTTRTSVKNVLLSSLALCAALSSIPAIAQTTLYNGIVLPANWPPAQSPTQQYQLPSYITSPPAVVPINVGRQLFVDDFLISQTTLTRTVHRPALYSGNPILSPGGWDNHNLAMPYSDGVWYDPSAQLYKMWYDGGYGNMVSYATSTDGLNWTKPSISDSPVPGSNMVLSIGGGRDSAITWLDLQDPNPARRYKEFAYYPVNANNPQMLLWFSPDGIHWTAQNNFISSLSDRTTLFWNPFRSVWVDGMRGKASLPATGSRGSYFARSRYYAESADLSTWTPSNPTASFWTGPDVNDPPYTVGGAPPELYNLDGVAYESVIVGLFSWLYPDIDLIELGAGFSRDGFQWVRPTRGSGPNAFIPASNQAGTWNAYNIQSAGGGFLVVGDQLWFYFSGRNFHDGGIGNGYTGLATLRRDGFYSMDAGSTQGTLITRPVQSNGTHFFVNVADPQGTLYVEAVDPSTGNVISPFSMANCNVVSLDSTRQEVTWKGASDLSALSGKAVQFRFYLTSGSLYSFWLSDASGASHGYVAGGGPGFTGPTDTVGNGMASTPPPPVTPTVTVTAPTSGQQVSGTSVTVSATASDSLGIASLQLEVDNANLGAACPASPCSVTWDTTKVTNGPHTISAVARDSGGNTGTATAVSVQVSNSGGGGNTTGNSGNSNSGAGYSYSRALTLSHARVPNTDQSNFPVLISGSYSFLATAANGGHVQNANGYDIIFTSDSAGQKLLNWELQSYNPATGAINAWVQVPTLSHTTDTVIYVFYGNSSVTSFQGGPPGSTWDSSYAGVWHFPNGSTLSTSDSTGQITLTNNGATATTGEIDGGAFLNNLSSGTYGYDLEAASSALATSGNKTFEAWINPSAFHTYAGQYTGLVTYGKAANVIYSLSLVGSGGNGTGATPRFEVQNASGSYENVSAGALSATGKWYHVVGVIASPNIYIYVNGVQNSAAYSGSPATGGSSFALSIGRDFYDNVSPPNRWFDGAIDEVRLSTTARSADWIATEYNNESSPSTFYGVGSEQGSGSNSNPPPAPVLTVCTGTNSCPGSLSFSGVAGEANPASQAIDISNSGGGTLSWTASSNQPWLSVSSPSGTGAQALNVSVSTAGLGAGSYSGAVMVSATGATGSPQSVDVSLSISQAQPPPSNTYSYSRALTLSHAQVPNTDQSNFPVLISGTYPSLATAGNGGHVQNANGYDIVFTSDAAGQNLLKWELQSYNPATGAIIAWVQVPTLSHTTDTVIYMFYGNAAVTTFQGGATGSAWDSNYAGVWHFPNGSTLSTSDSTGQISLTNNGATATTGEIDGGAFLNNVSYGTYGYDLEAASSALATSGSKTFETWMNPSAFQINSDQYTGLLTYGKGGNVIYSLSLVGAGNATDATPRFEVQNSSGSYQNVTAAKLSAAGKWYHIVGVVSSSNIYVYVNGVQTSAGYSGSPAAGGSTFALSIGRDFYDNVNPPTRWFDGAVDEVRLSKIARSADWIATEYNNQSSPGTFYSVGSEQGSGGSSSEPPPPAPVLSVCTGTNSCPGSLSFSGVAGGANPGSQTVNISNSGTGTLNWTASSNQTWLSVSSPGGTGAQALTVSVSTAGLNAGSYSGAVTVSAIGATGSPQSVKTTLVVSAAAATNAHYVSPTGSPQGDGSISNPWDLQTALNQPAKVSPGDTIWMRGGTYIGLFTSHLTGTTASPIVVRQYPGERASIAGQLILGQSGDHDTWFWGFEVYNRTAAVQGDCIDTSSSSGYAPGLRLINLVLHDCGGDGVGYWGGAVNSAVYGSLIYNNGYDSCDTACRGHGHGLYVQSTDSHLIQDNIVFRNFSEGTQLYGSSAAVRNNVTYLGNAFFNSGELSAMNGGGFNSFNIYVDGGSISQNTQLINNYCYSSAPAGHNQYYQFNDSNNAVVTGNYFLTPGPGVQGITVGPNNTGLTMTGNTFLGALNSFSPSSYPQNTYLSALPTTNWTFVRPNQYEPGRANVIIYNWSLQSSVTVDISSAGLHTGQTYKVLDSQNFFGIPVITGTYTGQPITIPMNNLTLAPPLGNVPLQPKQTAPQFDVFVVIPTSN